MIANSPAVCMKRPVGVGPLYAPTSFIISQLAPAEDANIHGNEANTRGKASMLQCDGQAQSMEGRSENCPAPPARRSTYQ